MAAKTTVTNSSSLMKCNRMDAPFHVAYNTHKAEVDGLVSRKTREELIAFANDFPIDQKCWEIVRRGSSRFVGFNQAYTNIDIALFIVLHVNGNVLQSMHDKLDKEKKALDTLVARTSAFLSK